MSLRNSLLSEIYNVIDTSVFTLVDFYINAEKTPDHILYIEFVHDRSFNFLVSELSAASLVLRFSPGQFRIQETMSIASPAQLPGQINSWISNIDSELKSKFPYTKDIEKIKDLINEHIIQHVSDSEAHFSEGEKENIHNKLNELVSKFESLKEQLDLKENEINQLKSDVESLKTNASFYTKGLWYRTAGVKIWNTVTKIASSKEGRDLLLQATKKAIGLESQ